MAKIRINDFSVVVFMRSFQMKIFVLSTIKSERLEHFQEALFLQYALSFVLQAVQNDTAAVKTRKKINCLIINQNSQQTTD